MNTSPKTIVLTNATLNRTPLQLWHTPERETVRVILVITLSCTTLLILWALIFVVCHGPVSSRREHSIIFFLNIFYVVSLMLSIAYFVATMYVSPSDASCSFLTAFSYLTVILTISTNVLTSLHHYVTSVNNRLTSWLTGTPRQKLAVLGLYFFIVLVVPVLIISIFIHSQRNHYTTVPRRTCWLTSDIWWLILPISVYSLSSMMITMCTCVYYRNIAPNTRCTVYSCLILNSLFSAILLVTLVDSIYRTVSTGFLILCLFLTHNLLVWMHITENVNELCPCAFVPAEPETLDVPGRPASSSSSHDAQHRTTMVMAGFPAHGTSTGPVFIAQRLHSVMAPSSAVARAGPASLPQQTQPALSTFRHQPATLAEIAMSQQQQQQQQQQQLLVVAAGPEDTQVCESISVDDVMGAVESRTFSHDSALSWFRANSRIFSGHIVSATHRPVMELSADAIPVTVAEVEEGSRLATDNTV